MNALVDFWLAKFRRLSLFGTARLTRHQFMRNFAFASFFAFFGVSIMSILTTWGLGMGFYFHGLHDHAQEMALLKPYIVGESLIFTLFAYNAQAFAAVQRFHDMNKSGWHTLTLLIPFYNFYVLYVLFMKDAPHSANQYGAAPHPDVEKKRRVEVWFVLSLLLLVFGRFL